jgi:hypothetical protein
MTPPACSLNTNEYFMSSFENRKGFPFGYSIILEGGDLRRCQLLGYIASNGRKIQGGRIGEDLKGNSSSLIELLSWNFPEGTAKNCEKPQSV